MRLEAQVGIEVDQPHLKKSRSYSIMPINFPEGARQTEAPTQPILHAPNHGGMVSPTLPPILNLEALWPKSYPFYFDIA
jgi:hypothetical protein